jgi:hypothetical protein
MSNIDITGVVYVSNVVVTRINMFAPRVIDVILDVL